MLMTGPESPKANYRCWVCLTAERSNRLLFTFINFKYSYQLGDLEHIAQPLADSGQLNVSPCRAGRRIDTNQGPKPTTINIADAGEIEDNLLRRCERAFQL